MHTYYKYLALLALFYSISGISAASARDVGNAEYSNLHRDLPCSGRDGVSRMDTSSDVHSKATYLKLIAMRQVIFASPSSLRVGRDHCIIYTLISRVVYMALGAVLGGSWSER